MRVLLFTGKGGVGKTTVAAATALHAARCGVKTLVVSADAAHSLADCLARPLGPAPVELGEGLSAVHVDVRDRRDRSWRSIADHLVGLLDAVGVDPLTAEDLTVLPGAEEVLALLEVRDLVADGDHDLVVVDCAPTAETLRLLALPEALARYVDHALPVERRIVRALATGARAARPAPGRRPAPPRDHVVEAAERLCAELAGVREVLAAPGTSVRLVLTPEAVVIAEARRTLTSLALYGYPVDGVVANRVVPPGGRDPWRTAWARTHAQRLAEAEAAFDPLPVLRAGYAPAEPLGEEALAALAERLYGPPDAEAARHLLDPPAPATRMRVERRTTDEYVLVLPLPLAVRDDVELARIGDELSIGVAGRRRVLVLPSGLRRCVVAGAGLRDGELRVRFRPDPALWRTP